MIKFRNAFSRALSLSSSVHQLQKPGHEIIQHSSFLPIYRNSLPHPNLNQRYLRSFSAVSSIPASQSIESYRTQRQPVYTLPFYGASEGELEELSDDKVLEALKSYGGLVRKWDAPEDFRDRLRKLTRAEYRKQQLTISGVVVSNKMDKSVVIAAKRRAYSKKLQLHYFKTKRFMAHDELNLCREGDEVVIRSCRILSRRKAHVVVQNFGDKTRPGEDMRTITLEGPVTEKMETKNDEQENIVPEKQV